MNIKLLIFSVLGILISINLFGQKSFIKPDYKLSQQKSKVTLIPIYNEKGLMNDSILSFIFSDTLQNLQFVKPNIARTIINSDHILMDILNKIMLKEYTKKEIKAFPNLSTILTTDEISYIKTKLDNSEFIFIPLAFNIKTIGNQAFGGYTLGFSKFRLYDITTGDFVLECPYDLNVNIGGARGAEYLTTVLIGETHVCFVKNFILKQNIK